MPSGVSARRRTTVPAAVGAGIRSMTSALPVSERSCSSERVSNSAKLSSGARSIQRVASAVPSVEAAVNAAPPSAGVCSQPGGRASE